MVAPLETSPLERFEATIAGSGRVHAPPHGHDADAHRPQPPELGPQCRMVSVVIVHLVYEAFQTFVADEREGGVALGVAALPRWADGEMTVRQTRRREQPRDACAGRRRVLGHNPQHVGHFPQHACAMLQLEAAKPVWKCGWDENEAWRSRLLRSNSIGSEGKWRHTTESVRFTKCSIGSAHFSCWGNAAATLAPARARARARGPPSRSPEGTAQARAAASQGEAGSGSAACVCV